MKTSQMLALFSLGAALIFVPGSAQIAHADKEHPVFDEHPGKHKGWDKDKKDKRDKHDRYETHGRRYDHVADSRHERIYPRTLTRTSTGYWHSHDRYPRHFHSYRRPAPVPPHQHVRREVVVVDKRSPVYKPVIRRDGSIVRDARNEVREGREQLRKDYAELQKDRAELRRDIRNGASKDEIRQGRKEIRDDYTQIRKSREELARDQARLNNLSRK
jgi:hypothetical protein